MSLTSLIKMRPEISDFLVSRISDIPTKPKFVGGVFPKTSNYSQIGTAFDYAFRFELLRKYPHASEKQWVSELGALQIIANPDANMKKWKDPAINTIESAKSARKQYYLSPNNSNLRKLVEMCFRLSHLDVVYRELKFPSGPVPKNGLMPAPQKQDVDDVVSMLSKSKNFLDSRRFSQSSIIALNPTFGYYSELVGGADADIITSFSLIDLKTSTHPNIGNYELAQIVGYYMLMQMNNENPLQISLNRVSEFPTVHDIGMFFSRFGVEYMIPTNNIILSRDDFLEFIRMVDSPPEVVVDPLQKLRKVGHFRSKALNEMGIKNVEDLAQIIHIERKREMVKGIGLDKLSSIARNYLEHNIELRNGVMIEWAKSQFDFNDEVYLDIETTGLSFDSQIWLIGMLFKKNNKLILLFAHESDEEKDILKQYMKRVSNVKGDIVTFSGHHFDKEFIEQKLKKYKLWNNSPKPNFVDVLSVIRDTIEIPVSNNLKDMAAWMGYNFKHPDLAGYMMPGLYREYLISRDQELLTKLQEYNEDDIRSLTHVVSFIRDVLS
ncbi:MAG TPA: ribonuclease H-like domain-containing protein [Ferroplasma sp.]|nr:ribonuclease H-like domain-containing protein [Ferroplasma sp.]